MIERINAWASARPDTRAVLLLGSAAMPNPDPWGDIDVLVFTGDVQGVLDDSRIEFSDAVITFLEHTAASLLQRRFSFPDGTDVDLVPAPAAALDGGALAPATLAMLQWGADPLYDSDGALARVLEQAHGWTRVREMPSPPDVDQAGNNFWFLAIWTAKKLRRGDLWRAIAACDGTMKELLLQAFEWEADRRGADPLSLGRFVHRWGEPEAAAMLPQAFARFDAEDIAGALLAQMDIYSRLLSEFDGYPYDAEYFARTQVYRLLGDGAK